MNTINDRINAVLIHYGLNKNSFSAKIGLENNVTIGNIVAGRKNKPSFDIIEKILLSFDSINAEWLITGKGEMLREENMQYAGSGEVETITMPREVFDQISKLTETLLSQQRAIETLSETNKKMTIPRKENF